MRKAGIVGGIGPASTLDYYKGIIAGCRKADDSCYPTLVIDNVDMVEMLDAVASGDHGALIAQLDASIENLHRAGADFAALASNTPHIVFDELCAVSSLPLVSIVRTTCDRAAATGLRHVLVLGTRFTMRNGLYRNALEPYGIEGITPDDAGIELVHGTIFPKLEEGIVIAEDKQRLIAFIDDMAARHDIDGVLLGCTELPLMIREGDLDIPVLDTTSIHIDAIVEECLKG